MSEVRKLKARIVRTDEGWRVYTTRSLRDVILARPPEVEVLVPFGSNPDIDRAGEGFYLAEVWPGEGDGSERPDLFNVLTERPCSRGLAF